LWNAFKRVVKPYSRDEQAMLLHDTAARIYQL
jgi:predicted TIM-barrel fold metal-dependent hydrolase